MYRQPTNVTSIVMIVLVLAIFFATFCYAGSAERSEIVLKRKTRGIMIPGLILKAGDLLGLGDSLDWLIETVQGFFDDGKTTKLIENQQVAIKDNAKDIKQLNQFMVKFYGDYKQMSGKILHSVHHNQLITVFAKDVRTLQDIIEYYKEAVNGILTKQKSMAALTLIYHQGYRAMKYVQSMLIGRNAWGIPSLMSIVSKELSSFLDHFTFDELKERLYTFPNLLTLAGAIMIGHLNATNQKSEANLIKRELVQWEREQKPHLENAIEMFLNKKGTSDIYVNIELADGQCYLQPANTKFTSVGSCRNETGALWKLTGHLGTKEVENSRGEQAVFLISKDPSFRNLALGPWTFSGIIAENLNTTQDRSKWIIQCNKQNLNYFKLKNSEKGCCINFDPQIIRNIKKYKKNEQSLIRSISLKSKKDRRFPYCTTCPDDDSDILEWPHMWMTFNTNKFKKRSLSVIIVQRNMALTA